MLCTTCQTKSTVQVTGNCLACGGVTTHFAYRLCGSCSQQMDQCQWCTASLSAPPSASAPAPTKVSFVFLRDNDDGRKVKGMNVGEQVKVELTEDQYSGRQWDVKSFHRSCFKLVAKGQFEAFPGNPQQGTRTFVFEVASSGAGDLEFHEVRRMWSHWGNTAPPQAQPVSGGKTWKADFQIS